MKPILGFVGCGLTGVILLWAAIADARFGYPDERPYVRLSGILLPLEGEAERNPQLGFGILLFFVVFEFGFISVCHVLAEPVLHALAWPAIIVGNLLAAIAMAAYFWRHHLDMHIEP